MRTSRMQTPVPLSCANTIGVIEDEHAHPSGCPGDQRLAELTPHLRTSRVPRLPKADILRPTALSISSSAAIQPSLHENH
jgi:hypothetical protein